MELIDSSTSGYEGGLLGEDTAVSRFEVLGAVGVLLWAAILGGGVNASTA